MKIAVVTPWYPNPTRPTEGVFVRNEVAALAAAGVKVFVVHLHRELPAGQVEGVKRQPPEVAGAEDGVPIVRVGMHPAYPLSVRRAAKPLVKLLKQADVVHSHAISVLPVMWLAQKQLGQSEGTKAVGDRTTLAESQVGERLSGSNQLGMKLSGVNSFGVKPWVHSEHWSALANPQTASPWLRLARPAFGYLLKYPQIVVTESKRLQAAVLPFRAGRADAKRAGKRSCAMLPFRMGRSQAQMHSNFIQPTLDGSLEAAASTTDSAVNSNAAPAAPSYGAASSTDSNASTRIVPCIVPTPEALVERPYHGDRQLRLASTGGVIDRKNPLLCVQIVVELKRFGVDASLRWSGVGPQMEECRRLAAELGADCQFLGSRTPTQVQAEIAACDIFLAPTKGDNFFVAAAEALVNGRPLCASPYGGHVEYADPRYSEIVEEQTPAAYAQALLRLRDKTRGVSAREISQSVASRFAPQEVARQLLDLYREVS